MGAAVFLLMVVTVMLIVPWMMGRALGERATPTAGLFTSRREQRLWLWALAVVVAIYATLGPAATLVAELRERNLLRVSMALIIIVVIGVVARGWVKKRPGRHEIAVVFGVALVYLTAWFRIHSPEERTHLFEYGLVAILIYQALIERRRNGRRVWAPAAFAVVLSALVGWLDEAIQSLLPNRVYDTDDVLVNTVSS